LALLRSSSTPLFFLLLPRPPPSPLFPYTTLFRSAPALPVVDPLRLAALAGTTRRRGHDAVQNCPRRAQTVADDFPGRLCFAGEEDRKSTRLNSSHVSISYAVFCLKKKKKINIIFM